MDTSITTIDDYLSQYPKEVQDKLQKIRKLIASVAPHAEESINYGIPTFRLKGNLVHFGAYPKHIGFYPTPPVILAFTDALKDYETSKGTVKFPLDRPIPYDLIEKMTKFRLSQVQ